MSKHISRKMSYLLRHDPEDLLMDMEGWVATKDLLQKLGIQRSVLEGIVANNDKKRFAFSPDKEHIRASQGHSSKLELDIKFDEVKFPTTYFHGTDWISSQSILKHGLNSRTRAKVHLSKDIKTAVDVGTRHIKRGGTVVVLEIDANQMKKDGFKIYESANGVILVDFVDPKYLKLKV